MTSNNDLFGMLQAEDKLDGTNYPMWSFMMKHDLVAKQLWNLVVDVDKQPASPTTQPIVIDPTTSSGTVAMPSPPTQEQLRWDGKDAQAYAFIALSVKRHIVPHIRSCTTSKQAWNTLASLYAVRNEARVAYLRKQLEDVCMAENETMDVYVTCIKDLKDQLANIDELIPDASLISTLLKGLPESFQSFATTLRLVAKGNPNMYTFDEVVSLLLQEEQSRVNRNTLIERTQALKIKKVKASMVQLWVHQNQSLNIPLPRLHLMMVIWKRRRHASIVEKVDIQLMNVKSLPNGMKRRRRLACLLLRTHLMQRMIKLMFLKMFGHVSSHVIMIHHAWL